MTEVKRKKILQNMAIITLALVSLYYINSLFGLQLKVLFGAFNTVILPFGIALFISYLLAPLIKLLESKFKIKNRNITIAIVFTILLIVLALFAWIIGAIIVQQAEAFVLVDWDNIIVQIENFVAQNETLQELYQNVTEYMTYENISPYVFDVFSIFSGLTTFVVAIVLVPVFLVFLLSDRDTVFKGILWVFPENTQKDITELAKRANNVTEKYFNGRFITMFIMSIVFTIMFIIMGFGIDKAIFFGFTLGFLDIIPYVGPFIGILLPVLYSFTIADHVMFGNFAFVMIIGFNLVVQFIMGNIIQPLIMGKEVNLHPLLVLTSFIFFGALFGITGVILAIPITGTLKAALVYYREVHTNG